MTFRELIEKTKEWLSDGWDDISGTFSRMGQSILDAEIATVIETIGTGLAWLIGGVLVLWVFLLILNVIGEFIKRRFDFFRYYHPPLDFLLFAIWLAIQALVVYGVSTTGFTLEHLVYMLPVLAIDILIIVVMYRRYKRLKSERTDAVTI